MEEMIKKSIQKEMIKDPSSDFTDKVMNEIFELKASTVSKPLISKGIWSLIGFSLMTLSLFAFFAKPQSTSNFEFAGLLKIKSFFSSVHFPNVDLSLHVNLYVVSGACIAIVLLTIVDVVLFRRK